METFTKKQWIGAVFILGTIFILSGLAEHYFVFELNSSTTEVCPNNPNIYFTHNTNQSIEDIKESCGLMK